MVKKELHVDFTSSYKIMHIFLTLSTILSNIIWFEIIVKTEMKSKHNKIKYCSSGDTYLYFWLTHHENSGNSRMECFSLSLSFSVSPGYFSRAAWDQGSKPIHASGWWHQFWCKHYSKDIYGPGCVAVCIVYSSSPLWREEVIFISDLCAEQHHTILMTLKRHIFLFIFLLLQWLNMHQLHLLVCGDIFIIPYQALVFIYAQ